MEIISSEDKSFRSLKEKKWKNRYEKYAAEYGEWNNDQRWKEEISFNNKKKKKKSEKDYEEVTYWCCYTKHIYN